MAASLLGTSKKGVEFIKHVSEILAKGNGFERTLEKFKISGGGDGKCSAEFTIAQEHLNRGGGLHGGFTATLVDVFTTFALMSKPCNAGVSVDMHISYLKGAKEGDLVVVDANCVRLGRNLAFVDCELRHKKDGSIIAKGGQTLYVNLKD